MSQCCGEIIYEGLCVRGRPVKVLDCVLCGFRHLHPKPTEEEMAAYYASNYFKTEKPDYAKTSGTESEYQFLVDKEKIEIAFRASWPSLSSPAVPIKVLDFGCGPNAPFLRHFAKLVKQRAFSGYGVEPSQASKTFSIDLGGSIALCVKSTEQLATANADHAGFDIIHLGFVLEHVVNPFKILLDLKKYLAPGGRLIIEVPNDWNPLQLYLWHQLGGVPWWCSSPDHVSMLSHESLVGVLNKTGFKPLASGSTYPVELFLAHGQDFRTDPVAKKAVVERRADLQKLWGQWPQGWDRQIGRTVWVVAEGMP